MLTETQKNKLSPLKNTKYGNILEDAEKTWSEINIFPQTGIFGINYEGNIFQIDETRRCCIIGASLIGKKILEDDDSKILYTASKYFNVSIKELWTILDGYDNFSQSLNKKYYPDAFNFGKSVRDAIFVNHNAILEIDNEDNCAVLEARDIEEQKKFEKLMEKHKIVMEQVRAYKQSER